MWPSLSALVSDEAGGPRPPTPSSQHLQLTHCPIQCRAPARLVWTWPKLSPHPHKAFTLTKSPLTGEALWPPPNGGGTTEYLVSVSVRTRVSPRGGGRACLRVQGLGEPAQPNKALLLRTREKRKRRNPKRRKTNRAFFGTRASAALVGAARSCPSQTQARTQSSEHFGSTAGASAGQPARSRSASPVPTLEAWRRGRQEEPC